MLFHPVSERLAWLFITFLCLCRNFKFFEWSGISALREPSKSLAVVQPDSSSPLTFLAVGDWGGHIKWPYSTKAQRQAAHGMDRVAQAINASFVVSLGDHFYPKGITNETSKKRFKATFERVYHHESLQVPWYLIAGNHDHLGDIQVQIDYSGRSKRWTFPSLYHTQSLSVNNVTLDLIMVDSDDLCSKDKDLSQVRNIYSPGLGEANDLTKWDWVEDQLNKSTAQYLWVVGHVPPYSVCAHGPQSCTIRQMIPLLQRYGAHYMAGHEHCMMHTTEKPIHQTQPTHFVLSGMGREVKRGLHFDNPLNAERQAEVEFFVTRETRHQYKADGGFTSFQATQEHMTVQYHNQNGDVLYTAEPIPPRDTNQL